MSGDYQLVPLANGQKTLFSASYAEKMHPGLGPMAEAELLYVRQLNIRERLSAAADEFVIWDIGLGGAANAIAVLQATREISGKLRLVSFDNTGEPLEFALNNSAALGYPVGYESQMAALLQERRTEFVNGKCSVNWEFHLADFPALLPGLKFGAHHSQPVPPPHAIFYDAFSPAKNPAMWTLPVFENLFRALDPSRPCALTTYSRSTLLRTTLLLAGFSVGTGHATGMKEETTIAANLLNLIAEPLNARWLERAMRSDSAEPLREPVYSRSPLALPTREKLKGLPQFQVG
ncbi:MAG TPA: MnmC family methyltransferase [Verrucomicrobiae bacterium]|nr:MnmC family methyltransferase [Verrucomicrobiae bacterium]